MSRFALVAFALSFHQLRKLVTAAAMNATNVEVDDAMSVLSSLSGEGVVGWCCEADESGTAGALPEETCDALSDCAMVTRGAWFADMT